MVPGLVWVFMMALPWLCRSLSFGKGVLRARRHVLHIGKARKNVRLLSRFKETNAPRGSLLDREGTVLIRHTQRSVPVDTELLERQVRAMLTELDLQYMDVGLWLSSDGTVRDWNARYRGKRKSTDILSFPFYDRLKAPDSLPEMESEDDMNLGDMIVSVPYVRRACNRDLRDALKMGKDAWERESAEIGGVSGEMMHYFAPQPRLALFVIHGICHLLGHDHEEDAEYSLMRAEEERLIQGLRDRKLLFPRDAFPQHSAVTD